MVAHLHGICEHPSTMRGSWVDVKGGLSNAKAVTAVDLVSRYVTVFVGYAALDVDIVPILKAAAPTGGRVYCVDPSPVPSPAIVEWLYGYSSIDNYISLPAEEFFRQCTPFLGQIAAATEKPRLERERGYAVDQAFGALRAASGPFFGSLKNEILRKGMRASSGDGSVSFEGAHLGECQNASLAADLQESELEGPLVELSSGGPNLIVGLHFQRIPDVNSARVVSYVLYIASGSGGPPHPPWPKEVWSCDQIQLTLLDEADRKKFHSWLETAVYATYRAGLARLLSLLARPGTV